MRNCLKKLCVCTLLSTIYCYGQAASFQYALTRGLSNAFEDSLKLNPPPVPIDLNLARQQHENYTLLLEKLVPQVIQIEADPAHPDCNFIEDTAIIVDGVVVISRMGAVERRGEEVPIAQAMKDLGFKDIVSIQSPGTMDGGDVLYTGKHLFVGISKRTNVCALDQLKALFHDKVEVIGIPVIEGLHLKSVISLFDPETLIVADTDAGMQVQSSIELATDGDYTFIAVPDSVASNVLRIGSTLLVQEGFAKSEAILQRLCDQKGVTLVKINMSELIKADGALTCGSLLFN